MLQALLATVVTLPAPRPHVSRERAFAVLGLLVETISGFAAGLAARGLAGDQARALIASAELGDARPLHCLSLVDELAARLARRLPREPVPDVVAARFGRELRAGWNAYLAAIGDPRGAPPDSPLWLAWTRRVHRESEPAPVRPFIAAIY